MTTFEETNCVLRRIGGPDRPGWYAACTSPGCGWVGPIRSGEAAAKSDGCRHHEDPGALR